MVGERRDWGAGALIFHCAGPSQTLLLVAVCRVGALCQWHRGRPSPRPRAQRGQRRCPTNSPSSDRSASRPPPSVTLKWWPAMRRVGALSSLWRRVPSCRSHVQRASGCTLPLRDERDPWPLAESGMTRRAPSRTSKRQALDALHAKSATRFRRKPLLGESPVARCPVPDRAYSWDGNGEPLEVSVCRGQ